eukprot:TRINITY_DN5627_c0_g1_i1.p1 TRINITY_DN5627_c0_g1~~TRINITY_DN5627_c0_g1_i1.p1  ORF type:complete len:622 (+),score=158.17 TRINITY_DN5627_c0_g1_i1:40-1905(+)
MSLKGLLKNAKDSETRVAKEAVAAGAKKAKEQAKAQKEEAKAEAKKAEKQAKEDAKRAKEQAKEEKAAKAENKKNVVSARGHSRKPSNGSQPTANSIESEYDPKAQRKTRLERALSQRPEEAELLERGVLHKTRNIPVFAVPLGQVTYTSYTEYEIPPVFLQAAQFLRDEHRLEIEGLFRISGGAEEVKQWKEQLDLGKDVTFNESTNPHSVSGLLKLFFRELPDPLLTFKTYNKFCAAATESKTDEERQTRFKALLKTLPLHNVLLLEELLKLLREVSSHADVNKMHNQNLGIVFGPTLMRPKEIDMSMSTTPSTVVEYLLDEYNSLFPLHAILVAEKLAAEKAAAAAIPAPPSTGSIVAAPPSTPPPATASIPTNQPPILDKQFSNPIFPPRNAPVASPPENATAPNPLSGSAAALPPPQQNVNTTAALSSSAPENANNTPTTSAPVSSSPASPHAHLEKIFQLPPPNPLATPHNISAPSGMYHSMIVPNTNSSGRSPTHIGAMGKEGQSLSATNLGVHERKERSGTSGPGGPPRPFGAANSTTNVLGAGGAGSLARPLRSVTTTNATGGAGVGPVFPNGPNRQAPVPPALPRNPTPNAQRELPVIPTSSPPPAGGNAT